MKEMKTAKLMRWRQWAVVALVAVSAAAVPSMAEAKGGGGDRVRWRGIVQARPAGLVGSWVVGGRSFTTTRGTQFDQLEGPLTIGSCAKVDIRNGQVHEVDSEPIGDC